MIPVAWYPRRSELYRFLVTDRNEMTRQLTFVLILLCLRKVRFHRITFGLMMVRSDDIVQGWDDE